VLSNFQLIFLLPRKVLPRRLLPGDGAFFFDKGRCVLMGGLMIQEMRKLLFCICCFGSSPVCIQTLHK